MMTTLVRISISLLFGAAVLSGGSSWSADDEIIPRQFPLNRYLPTWNNSPFLRSLGTSVSLSEDSESPLDLSMEGLVIDGDKGSIVYLRDRSSGAILIATENVDPSHPFVVASTRLHRDPSLTIVSISDGNKTSDLRFASSYSGSRGDQNLPAASPNLSERSLPMMETVRDTGASVPKTAVSGPPGKRFRIPVPDQLESKR